MNTHALMPRDCCEQRQPEAKASPCYSFHLEHVGCIRPQRLPTTAPFNVCVYKVSDKAGDCWEDVQKYATYALYQVQIAHEARPSILISLRDSFSDFLKEMESQEDHYQQEVGGIRELLYGHK